MTSNKFKVVFYIIFIMLLVLTFGSSSVTFAISDNILSIHLSKGCPDKRFAFFIATDSSHNQTTASKNENFWHKINFAPLLSSIPKLYIQQEYDFINGIKGEGPFGFQPPVASVLQGG